MRVVTESGSIYEFRHIDGKLSVRRRNDHAQLRRDNQWCEVYKMIPEQITVGLPMVLVLEPLSESADFTTRTTSRVDEIWA